MLIYFIICFKNAVLGYRFEIILNCHDVEVMTNQSREGCKLVNLKD